MTTAQLSLPFDLPEPTQQTLFDRSQESSSNTTVSARINDLLPRAKSSYRVSELIHPSQDLEIVQLAEEFVQDVDLDEYVDELSVRRECIRIRTDVDRNPVNCFIVYYKEQAVGFLVGGVSKCFHRPGLVAEQKLWYVTPKYRASAAPLLLIRAYEDWARSLGATQLFTGTANKRYAEKTIKILGKLGYAQVGALLVKEI